MGVSGSHGLLLDVNAHSADLLSNIVGIAPSLSFLRFGMPKLCAKAAFTSKQSPVNCSLQSTECSVASHCVQDRLTCLTHFVRRTGSFGNLNMLIELVGVLEQPTATQRRTILHNRKVKRRKNVRLLCRSSASVPVRRNSKPRPEAKISGRPFERNEYSSDFYRSLGQNDVFIHETSVLYVQTLVICHCLNFYFSLATHPLIKFFSLTSLIIFK